MYGQRTELQENTRSLTSEGVLTSIGTLSGREYSDKSYVSYSRLAYNSHGEPCMYGIYHAIVISPSSLGSDTDAAYDHTLISDLKTEPSSALDYSELLLEKPMLRDFCERLGIAKYLQKNIDIIYHVFPSVLRLEFRLEQDPETGDEWLGIDMTVRAEVDEFLNSYDDYIEKWQEIAPWPISSKIVLSYNIL